MAVLTIHDPMRPLGGERVRKSVKVNSTNLPVTGSGGHGGTSATSERVECVPWSPFRCGDTVSARNSTCFPPQGANLTIRAWFVLVWNRAEMETDGDTYE